MKNKIKTIVLPGTISNTLEWYDFAVYAYLAPIIGQRFFPSNDKVISLLATFGVFAVGFLMRPLGAIFWGHYGDRVGRKTTLIITISILSITTTLIGLLPNYNSVGIIAPLALILCRLLQGFALGGEPGYTVYLVETAPEWQRGFYGSITSFGANAGFLLGSAITALLSSTMSSIAFSAWGWRLPFLLGLILGAAALYFRLQMPETKAFSEIKTFNRILRLPLFQALKTKPKTICIAMGLAFIPIVTFYITGVFLPSYLHTYVHVPMDVALQINTVSMAIMAVFSLVFGYIADKVGRKVLVLLTGLSYLILSYPLFLLMLSGSYSALLGAQIIFGILNGMCFGPLIVLIIEMFPTNIRYTATAFSINSMAALFGGTSPLIATYITELTGNILTPAFMLMLIGLFACFIWFLVSETYKEPLL